MFVAALFAARAVVIPIVGAAVLAVIVTPIASFLTKRLRFPNGLAAFGASSFAIFVILVLVGVAAPTVQQLTEDFPTLAYRVEYKLRSLALSIEAVNQWSKTVENMISPGQPDEQQREIVVKEGGGAIGLLINSAPVLVAQIVFMLVLVFFFVRERRSLQRLIVSLAPTRRMKLRTGRVCRVVRHNAASYLLAVSIINVALGTATAIAFYFIGMPAPIVWGAAMAILNFLPFIGPLILQVISLLAGLVIYPSIEAALIPPAVLILLNLVESNFGMPLVMEHRFMTSPLATLIGIAFGAWLWGTAGAILAVPLVVMVTTGANAWGREWSARRRRGPRAAQLLD